MTSDFASEVATDLQNPQNPQIAQNGDLDNYAIGAKFRRPNRKSGSPSKNLTSDLALEVAI